MNNFSITQEDLEKCERKVPIFAIWSTLTGEQKVYVEWDMISVKYLTPEQLQRVEDALAFDVAVSDIQWDVAEKAYLCL